MFRTLTLALTLAACNVPLEAPVDGAESKMQMVEDAEAVTASGTCATAELCADDLAFTDVYVSEVMPDPTACTDATGEWIEVVNRTDKTVDLNGAILVDGSSGARTTLKNLPILAPGQYAVLGRGTAATFCGPAADGFYGSSFILNNAGDSMRLEKPSGGLIDIVLSWPAVIPGTSFETSPMDGWAWLPSTEDMGAGEKGTPGTGPEDVDFVRPLSMVAAGDLEITEIMGDPTCAYDTCEWIEVKNWSGVPVDLSGLEVVDLGGNAGQVWDLIVAPYDRVVLGRYDAGSFGDASVVPDAFYGNVGLNNTNEKLLLMDGDRVLFETPTFPTMTSGKTWSYTGWGATDLANWTVTTPTPGY